MRIIFSDWCDAYNEDFTGGRIPPNGTKFEVIENFESSTHDCVTRPELHISLPPDRKYWRGDHCKLIIGNNVNR